MYIFTYIDEISTIFIYVDKIRQNLYLCNVSCKIKEFNDRENIELWRPKYKTNPDQSINTGSVWN